MYFLILYSCIISPHSFITRFFFLTKVEHFSLVSFYNNPSCKKLESLECKWLEDRSGSIALLRWRIFRPELFHHQILPSGNHLKKKKSICILVVIVYSCRVIHSLQNAFTFPQFNFSTVGVKAIGLFSM